MTGRYVSWVMVPGILMILLGGATLVAAAADEDRSADLPLGLLAVGVVLVVFGACWEAERRRRERMQGH